MTASEALHALPAWRILAWVAVPASFWIGFCVFAIYRAVRHPPPDPRLTKLSKNRIVPMVFVEYGYTCLIQAPVWLFLALHVSADAVSYLALAVAAAGAVFFGMGWFCLGGWLLFLSFTLDAVDGIVARAQGTSSSRGEFLDALIDRYADFAVSLGTMWYYRAAPVPLALAAAAMVGTQVMGYARAKGESLGIDPNVGFMQRHERAILFGTAAVMSPFFATVTEPGVAHPQHYLVVFVVGVIAIFTNLTAVQRSAYVMSRIGGPPAAAPAAKGELPGDGRVGGT